MVFWRNKKLAKNPLSEEPFMTVCLMLMDYPEEFARSETYWLANERRGFRVDLTDGTVQHLDTPDQSIIPSSRAMQERLSDLCQKHLASIIEDASAARAALTKAGVTP